MEKRDYFISYTNRTKKDVSAAEWVEWFCRVELGKTSYMQKYDFKAGESFREKEHEALENTKKTLGIMTEAYQGSDFCKEEWLNTRKKNFIAIKFDDCKMEGLHTTPIYIDLHNKTREEAMEALKDGLLGVERPDEEPENLFFASPASKAPDKAANEPPYPRFGLPDATNLPYRNKRFTGRVKLLEDIAVALSTDFITVVSGGGGFGKTETAVEYAYRNADAYDVIWMLNAENETALQQNYYTLARKLGFAGAEGQDFLAVREIINGWLCGQGCYLLIFDNAEGVPDLQKYLPERQIRGHIIVSTRDSAQRIQGKKIKLGLFNEYEARQFLHDRITHEGCNPAGDLDKLAGFLGYLPLALEQAAAYIIANGYTIDEYTAELSEYSLEMMDDPREGVDVDRANRTARTTYDISMKKIDMESARQLFNICAWLASDNIPLDTLIKGREYLPDELKGELMPGNIPEQNKMLRDTARYSLMTFNRVHEQGVLLSMHRIIQAVVREKHGEDTRWLRYGLDVMYRTFEFKYDTRESFDAFRMNLDCAVEAADHTARLLEDDGEAMEKTGRLYNEAGVGLYKCGQYDGALELYNKALVVKEKALGKEHPSTATTYNNIALVYDNQGDYRAALEWHEKARAIYEKVLGNEHPDTATTYNNIAGVYDNQGDYRAALEWNEKARVVREKALGKEHPNTATTYNNIALVYNNQGDYRAALEWYMKALAIDEKVSGKEHPSTATTYNNIAGVYDNQGDYRAALEWYKKALDIDERVSGKDHPDTATTYNNIAVVYSKQGDYRAALEWFLKSYRIRIAKLGNSHPYTIGTMNDMKSTYKKSGLPEPFEDWLRRSLPSSRS
ncbi:MAG: toll/interleukin-1 receptor domain-containing protein [Clostridiales bacterium]|nr:toll/interleukin-1 receptor domain-containing protein [Clostridiales bacterium]